MRGPSIPEASVLEPKSRGVLGRPVEPNDDKGCMHGARSSRHQDIFVLPSTITEPARNVPLYGEYDVAVLGGGPAGIAASVAAARGGRRTLLVERYGFLGGT